MGTVLPRITPQGSYFFEVVKKAGVIRGMGSYYFKSVILPKCLGFLFIKLTFHMTIGIRQQRISLLSRSKKRLSTRRTNVSMLVELNNTVNLIPLIPFRGTHRKTSGMVSNQL